jgi:hydrogenase maturation protease
MTPERILTKISSKRGNIVVFDAVEASREPGEIIFCKMAETKYGFFVTHNLPLKLIPGLSTREDDVYLVGIQPASIEVGEGLTDRVDRSVREVIAAVTEGVAGRS